VITPLRRQFDFEKLGDSRYAACEILL